MPSWLLIVFLFILFAQICLCVEFCVFRLKIGATALEHLCIAYHRAKKVPIYAESSCDYISHRLTAHIYD